MTSAGIKPKIADDPEAWVDLYADSLYRFAVARVRRPEVAEDLVHDTFLSGFHNRHQFKGDSAVLAWLTGILKNKIVDYFREKEKALLLVDIDVFAPPLDEFFDEVGRWKKGPAKWAANPQAPHEALAFWDGFHHCLEMLSDRLAAVFSLSEMDGHSTQEICRMLHITPTNLWARLYRVRAKMRKCLESSWFEGNEAQEKKR